MKRRNFFQRLFAAGAVATTDVPTMLGKETDKNPEVITPAKVATKLNFDAIASVRLRSIPTHVKLSPEWYGSPPKPAQYAKTP